jgi:hypothetical protein
VRPQEDFDDSDEEDEVPEDDRNRVIYSIGGKDVHVEAAIAQVPPWLITTRKRLLIG